MERNLTRPAKENTVFPEKVDWLIHNKPLNYLILGFSLIVIIALLPSLSDKGLIGSLLAGILSATYSLVKIPTFMGKGGLVFKEHWLLKPLILSAVWIFLTLFLPIVEGEPIALGELLLLVGIWFCWVFSNSIFFDIRDRQTDQSMTIAKKVGKQNAHKIIYLLYLIQFLLIFLYAQQSHNYLFILTLPSTGIAFLFCNHYYSQRESVPFHLFTLTDLTLILPSLFHLGLEMQTFL